MADQYSTLAKKLEPYIVALIGQVTGKGGGGASSLKTYPIATHALFDTDIHTGLLADSQAPQFLKLDGSRALAGNLPVVGGVTIDGVDLSVHVADPDAHHNRATSANAEISVSGTQVLTLGSHDILARHTVTGGAALDVVGQSAAGVLARLTPSSDVSAGTAAILKSTPAGGLTLASLATSGSANIGQELYAGNNGLRVVYHTADYPHVHVIINPGGSWSLDEQFGLDVDDNLLVRGWIVGKHAIQVKDAIMLLHFDGPEPFATNYKGQSRGHMGQAPGTYGGGVIYREGYLGKAVQLAEATQNLVTNPNFETGLTGWSAYATGAGAGTFTRGAFAKYGSWGLRVEKNAGAAGDQYGASIAFNTVSGTTYTGSVWVDTRFLGAGVEARLTMAGTGVPAGTTAVRTGGTAGWQRMSVTFTATASAGAALRLFVTNGSGIVRFDAVQVEEKAYATPYADGSLGGGEFDNGHTWSGTAHNSSSTRPIGRLDYPANDSTFKAGVGTIMGWAYHESSGGVDTLFEASDTGFTAFAYVRRSSMGRMQVRWGGAEFTGSTTIPDYTWTHYALSFDGSALRLMLNGKLEGTGTGASFVPARVHVGHGSGIRNLNGLLDDLCIIGRALTGDEVRAIYESNAPVFAETSTWHWRAGRNRLWVDEEGLWGFGASGGAIIGLYAGEDNNPAATKSWGGLTLSEGDLLLGRYGAANGGWMHFDQDLVGGLPGWKFGYGDKTVLLLDSGGATLDGVLDISTAGGIYQGTGSFASPTTGLRIWNDSGVGRIGGYNAGTAQWYAATDGKLYAGGGSIILSAAHLQIGVTTNAPVNDQTKIVFHPTGGGSRVAEIYGYANSLTGVRLLNIDMPNVGEGGDIMLKTYSYTGQMIYLSVSGETQAVVTNRNFSATGAVSAASLAASGNINADTGTITGQRLSGYQNSATAAIGSAYLYQADLSEEFINFVSTAGAGNPIDTAALGAYQGKIRVKINGVARYIPYYA